MRIAASSEGRDASSCSPPPIVLALIVFQQHLLVVGLAC